MHEHELVPHAVKKGEVLIITTSSHSIKKGSSLKTGCWLSEVAEPYCVFRDAGYDVTIASINGGKIPLDEASLKGQEDNTLVKRFLADETAQQEMEHSASIERVVDPTSYDIIFLSGGHGAMADMPESDLLADILEVANVNGQTVIAAVCHGLAGLLKAKASDGKPLLAGKRVTGFTNAEEEAAGKANDVPYSLEGRLKELGATFHNCGVWLENVVRDGRLVTGQNPASSRQVALVAVSILTELKGGKAE